MMAFPVGDWERAFGGVFGLVFLVGEWGGECDDFLGFGGGFD